MIARRNVTLSIILIAIGATSLAGCASRSSWDSNSADAQPRRDRNVLTAEQIAEYPQDYAVSRILTEAFPGIYARNDAMRAGSPLIILNGIPGSTVGDLRAWDIERIEVRYDAATMALYGFRGNAGVILISTFRPTSTAGS